MSKFEIKTLALKKQVRKTRFISECYYSIIPEILIDLSMSFFFIDYKSKS